MSQRIWCQKCDRYPEGTTSIEVSRAFDGYVFKAKVNARRCLKCRQKFPVADAEEDLDRRIALRLALSWPPRPAAMALLRQVIGVSAKNLAALLGVTPETVSRWEHGRLTPGRQTVALLAQLAQSRGNCLAAQTLETLKSPNPLAKVIYLDRR